MVKTRRIASLYSITVGMSMMGMWIFFLASGKVPELQSVPIETAFSILADNLTAAMLLIGGYGLYIGRRWGLHSYLVSLGALFYSLMIAIGYYAQREDVVFVGVFAPILLLMIAFYALSFKQREKFETL